MSTPNFIEIEKYIRETIAKNDGSFNRDAILMQSKEWMETFPVEFNSILNMIENEGRNDGCDFMDDSMPSMHLGGYCDDDFTPSVAFGSRFDDDFTPSVAFGSRFDDNFTPSMPSFHHGGIIYAADETPSILRNQDDPMGSPIGSDEVDSSPNGNADDDEIDSYMPLQRTMSSLPPSRK